MAFWRFDFRDGNFGMHMSELRAIRLGEQGVAGNERFAILPSGCCLPVVPDEIKAKVDGHSGDTFGVSHLVMTNAFL